MISKDAIVADGVTKEVGRLLAGVADEEGDGEGVDHESVAGDVVGVALRGDGGGLRGSGGGEGGEEGDEEEGEDVHLGDGGGCCEGVVWLCVVSKLDVCVRSWERLWREKFGGWEVFI